VKSCPRVIAIVPVLDEEKKIGNVVRRISRDVVERVLVVDDGSQDSSREVAAAEGADVHPLGRTVGVGAAIRYGYRVAEEDGFDIAVVLAGNDKDFPEEIPLLLEPIVRNEADLVQGSRYLSGHGGFGDMPFYRRVATRLHPLLMSVVAGYRFTDSTNGFRAVTTSLLRDRRLGLDSSALDEYGLEPHLLFMAARLGHRVTEVPVRKVYPPRHLGQTKMRPVVGWWSILRPLVWALVRRPWRAVGRAGDKVEHK
tara:strand:- start:2628 stop:3389 length:762 start_codon:yes stop_codon:yes gene_type:complete